jgi:cob(I)alamin adenosyltransferase
MGLGFVGILGDTLPIEDHKAAARKALNMFVEEKNLGKWHLIALDEINVALSLGLLDLKDVIEAVKDYPDDRILILSGRGATQELIDVADLVTEMREIKHPFAQGGKARPTVEF